jgi:MFS family permease
VQIRADRGHGAGSQRRVLGTVLAAVTVSALPVLLVGALAPQIREVIPFSPAQLGVGVTVYFLGSGLFSVLAGRFAERAGAAWGLRIAILLAAASMAGLAAATSWSQVLWLLAVGGIANGAAQPPGSALLITGIRMGRQGLAFGLKQASIPLAALLAGLAVPGIALTVGWRWAFVAGAAVSLVALAIVPAEPGGVERTRARMVSLRGSYGALAALAAGAALGAAAVTPLTAFVTSSGLLRGLSPAAAGFVLAAGSVVGIVSRVAAGWTGDRSGPHRALTLIGIMLVAGAAGMGLMGMQSASLYVLGVLLAFGAGWSWQGLFGFAVAARWPRAPAAATGVAMTGIYLGAAAGPFLFGVITEAATDRHAWLVMAVLATCAAALVAAVRLAAYERIAP